MNTIHEEGFENALRRALREDTPPAADALIRAAIHGAREGVHGGAPSRTHAMHISRWAAAAGMAVAVGLASWMYGRGRNMQNAALREEGDIMLEIIGLASVDSVYSMDESIYAAP